LIARPGKCHVVFTFSQGVRHTPSTPRVYAPVRAGPMPRPGRTQMRCIFRTEYCSHHDVFCLLFYRVLADQQQWSRQTRVWTVFCAQAGSLFNCSEAKHPQYRLDGSICNREQIRPPTKC